MMLISFPLVFFFFFFQFLKTSSCVKVDFFCLSFSFILCRVSPFLFWKGAVPCFGSTFHLTNLETFLGEIGRKRTRCFTTSVAEAYSVFYYRGGPSRKHGIQVLKMLLTSFLSWLVFNPSKVIFLSLTFSSSSSSEKRQFPHSGSTI